MTRWLKSTTSRSYTCGGVTVGNKEATPLTDAQLAKLKGHKVFAALIKAGSVVVLNGAPEKRSDSELAKENALLRKELEAMKDASKAAAG